MLILRENTVKLREKILRIFQYFEECLCMREIFRFLREIFSKMREKYAMREIFSFERETDLKCGSLPANAGDLAYMPSIWNRPWGAGSIQLFRKPKPIRFKERKYLTRPSNISPFLRRCKHVPSGSLAVKPCFFCLQNRVPCATCFHLQLSGKTDKKSEANQRPWAIVFSWLSMLV